MSTMMKRKGRPFSTDPRRSNHSFSVYPDWNFDTLIDTAYSFLSAVFRGSDWCTNCFNTSISPISVDAATFRALSAQKTGILVSLTRLTISVVKFFVVFLAAMLPLITVKEDESEDAQICSWRAALIKSSL